MRRTIGLAAATVLLLLGLPAAHAKGPVALHISGDGVAGTISVGMLDDINARGWMHQLGDSVGFFDLVFGESKRVTKEPPRTSLSAARLTLEWDMTGDGRLITQHVYMPVGDLPVAHVEPGQALWEDVVTTGGWLIVTGNIAEPLAALGVDIAALDAAIEKGPIEKKSVDEAAPKTPAVNTPVEKVPAEKAPVDKVPAEKAAIAEARVATTTPAAAAPAATATFTESANGGVDIVPVLTLIALLAIIGATAWVRRRPAAQ